MSSPATSARLAVLKAKLLLASAVEKAGKIGGKGGWNRHPAGSSKGGQFAPTNMGGGFGAKETAAMQSFMDHLGFGGSSFKESGWAGSGMWSKPQTPPKGAKPHPQVNDKGQPVTINYPTKPSDPATWKDRNAVATFAPGSAAPSSLNGVAMKPWSPPAEGWGKVGGTNEKLDALFPFDPPPAGKSTGAGVLVVEPDGRIWLTKPTNEFGGYKQTYPKGTTESGLTMQQNAIKEAYEETGLKVEITGVLGDYDRTTSRARMYLARRVGGTPKDMGWESQAVRLAPLKAAKTLLNMPHDKAILEDLEDYLSFDKAKGAAAKPGQKPGHWQSQPRWPGGSPLGGQWKSVGADGLTMPPTIAGGASGANPAYQKAVNAAHSAAQSGDLSAAKAVAEKWAPKFDQFMLGAKGSSHMKWGAQAAQYAQQLLVDGKAKTTATAAADAIRGPVKLSALTYSAQKPGGSNPGGIYTDGSGTKWLVKGSNAAVKQDAKTVEDRSRNEVLAAKLMQAAGVGAPDMKLVDLEGKFNGGVGVASKMIDGLDGFNAVLLSHKLAAREAYAVHAWLANYDALGMGYDNTMIGADGKAVNIDTGGALLFRAQGAKKGAEHGVNSQGLLDPTAPEWESMRKTSAEQVKVYGPMTQSALQESAQKLANLDDATITKLVKTYGPGDAAFREKLAQNLIDRKNAILDKAGLAFQMKIGPVVASGGEAAPRPAKAPKVKPSENVAAAIAAHNAQVASAGQTSTDVAKIVGTALTTAKNALAKGTVYSKPDPSKYGTSTINGSSMKESANDALNKGDLHGLAAIAQKVQATITGATGLKLHQSQLEDHLKLDLFTSAGMKFLAQQALQDAGIIAAAAPKIDIPPKPVFEGPQKSANAFYNKLADSVAGVLKGVEKGTFDPAVSVDALKGWNSQGKYDAPDGSKVQWKPGTANGTKLQAYYDAAMAFIQQKAASETVARVKQADKAVSTPKVDVPEPGKATPKSMGAMPNFDAAKLPASNSNAASHNGKVDKIAALAAAGDEKGLLSLNYGTNTYGKKQADLANSALAAMGSPHAVAVGQKASSHPALFGGVTAAQATAAAATVKTEPPAKHKAATKVDLTKIDVSKTTPPTKPTFSASSKAWVNEQNNKLAAEIAAIYQSGNLIALQQMTYDKLDKETGKVIGKASITEHPAKEIGFFHGAAVSQLRDIAYPPEPLKHFDASIATSLADIDKAFPGKKFGTKASAVKANEKLDYWIALGQVGNVDKLIPSKTMDVSAADKAKASADYKAFPKEVRSFIQSVQSSGSYNKKMDKPDADFDGTYKVKDIYKAIVKHAQPKPPGTTIYRWQHMPEAMVKQLKAAKPGLVIQNPISMCASMHPTNTQGFGPHRLKIVYAPGAKAIDSHGSGGYKGEQEITILPQSRFVLLKTEELSGNKGTRLEVTLLMLPPQPLDKD